MPIRNLFKTHNFSDITVIPDSLLEVEPTAEQKTLLVSRIARLLGIFQVEGVIIYKYSKNRGLHRFFCNLLNYLVLPPYLKKYIPIKKELRYVGLSYPLNIAIHQVSKSLKEDPIRLGYVISINEDYISVDVGTGSPVKIKVSDPSKIKRNSLVLVDAEKGVLLEKSRYYTGFRIECPHNSNELFRILSRKKKDKYTIIGTSVKGKSLRECRKCFHPKRIILFGDHHRSIFKVYNIPENTIDEVINVLPGQGTTTIRTEEAICISLSRLHNK